MRVLGRSRSRALAAGSVAWALAACSLTTLDRERCEADGECRAAFGWGSTCGDDGFCSEIETHPRCSRTFPEDLFESPEAYRDHTVIGGLYGYEDHLETLQSSELAIRQVRESEVEFDLEYAWVVCDYTANAGDALDDLEATTDATKYLAEVLHVPAIVGPRGSSRSQAAFEAASPAGTLVISPSATSPALTEIDEPNPSDETPGLLWRTAPPDSLQSLVIASDLRTRGIESIAIIAQSGVYGDSLAELLRSEFLAQGGVDAAIEPFTTDIYEAIADVAASDAEEVVFISSDIDDYIAFLIGAVASSNLEAQYDAMGIFLPDAAFDERVIAETVDSSELLFDNIRGSRPAVASGPLFDGFAAALNAEYGTSASGSGFVAHAYDAAWLVLYGTVWAHTQEEAIDGLGVARGLRRVSDGTPVEIRVRGWADVVAEFSAGGSIDVEGASGSLDYDPATEETTAPIEVWTIVPDAAAAAGYAFATDYVVEP